MDTRIATLHRMARAAWDAGRVAEWAMHCATIAKAEARRTERQQVAA